MSRPKVPKDKAMELANLVLLAYHMYEDFAESTALKTENDWSFPNVLHGSAESSFDYRNPLNRHTNEEPIEYEVLAEFWHTDRPVGRLRLETVPFGFIASRKSTHALKRRQEVFVVFRGTLNSQEWAANSRYRKAQVVKGIDSEGYIHQGFNSVFEVSYLGRLGTIRGFYTNTKRRLLGAQPPLETRQRSIRETLESVLFNSDLVDTDAHIYITGHSLGGALALLAGRVIANSGRLMASGKDGSKINLYSDSLAICTFAGPRVGDKAFKSVFKDITVVRYVNSEDIVPTVPPATSKLLGEDMRLTPEGLQAFKAQGVASVVNTFNATAGTVQRDSKMSRNVPFTHIGQQRTFTLSQDSISFNHNHEVTYREGILRCHEARQD
jgi:hypothetical protein